ncbi:MAG: hypothetical protein E7232_15860 [Lachnospiraceae bacterium]|jgi:hypothetical protein|nr:hypothetical protein [Lachnospiraceae bacterium]MBP3240013.1 hypothetical protein [Oribacterium sp.]
MDEARAILGWISPDGTFTPYEWGEHTEGAVEIINKNGWYHEFCERYCANERDFLCDKGYCLLHDPGKNNISATHIRPLTTRQRDFLYGYFIDLGDHKKANQMLLHEF